MKLGTTNNLIYDIEEVLKIYDCFIKINVITSGMEKNLSQKDLKSEIEKISENTRKGIDLMFGLINIKEK